MKQNEFRYKGKNLGLEKLNILKMAYDNIKDYDIEYMIIDNDDGIIDTTDWVGEALEIVSVKYEDKKLIKELTLPWHIQIINTDTLKEISKSRFRKLFGDALMLEHREEEIIPSGT